jgi:hypothetical protein
LARIVRADYNMIGCGRHIEQAQMVATEQAGHPAGSGAQKFDPSRAQP